MNFRPKKQSALEKETQARILNVLRRLPWVHVERNNSGKRPNPNNRWVSYGLGKGSSDLIVFVKPFGMTVAIEIKQVGKKATKSQRAWMAAVGAVGVRGIVATSREEAIDAVLATYEDGLALGVSGARVDREVDVAFHQLQEARKQIKTAYAEADAIEQKRSERKKRTPKIVGAQPPPRGLGF